MLAVFPVILPFLTGILLLLQKDLPSLRRGVSLASLLLQLGVALTILSLTFSNGSLVALLGSWQAPIGIVLVADKAAALLAAIAIFVTLAASLVGHSEEPAKEESPLRLPLIHFLLTGIQLSFLTGDLFNLFVAFEVMLLSSYSLMTLEGRASKLREAYPYVILNLVGSAIFLAACGFAYSLFGSLNMAHIAGASRELAQSSEGAFKVSVLTALLAFVFSIKAGMFPLYFWLPNSYPILPPSIGAIYAGLLTKVGIYVLMRLLGTLMPHDQTGLYLLIAWLGGGTMLFGVLGAVSRMRIREILAFHVLSQVGFMILAIGFFSPLSFAATLFYMVHHIIVKAGLFLTSSGVMGLQKTDHLKKNGGLWKSHPALGVIFLILALSLAGLPPLSGFWAKLWILLEGLQQEYYILVAISLIASVLTLASMLKIWLGAFWKPTPETTSTEVKWHREGWLGLGLLTVFSICVILLIQPLYQMAVLAATEIMDPAAYVESVFPGSDLLESSHSPIITGK